MLLSEEQRLVRDTARAFAADHLAPHAAEWERDGTFPRAAFAEMGRLGLMGVTVPTEWGGAGADTVSLALALEEIAAGDGAVATVMSGHNSVGCMPLVDYGTEEQKAQYLPALAEGRMLSAFCLTEPQGGSDAARLQTRARADGDGYVISGTKQFITTGANADLALVFAVTDPTAGKRGISCFLVPTDSPGYEVARTEKKMGQNASDTCQIHFADVRVDASARLGAAGEGYKIALSNLEGGRIGIAAQAVGMARAALDCALDYAGQRETFGKPIIEHQAVAFRIADRAADLEAARQLVLHAAALKTAGQPCLKEASMAKLFASEAAERITSDALQTLGGYGYLQDFPIERICRGVRVTKIYEGTNDIQRLVISRALAGET